MNLAQFMELLVTDKRERNSEREYYICGNKIIPSRYINEHDKGHRPINHIETEYFDECFAEYLDNQGKKISMSFFQWYLKNHCEPCECERFYENEYEYAELDFYDIVACCEKLKNSNIEAFKAEYKKSIADKKARKNISDEYYYAKIQFYAFPTEKELNEEEIERKKKAEEKGEKWNDKKWENMRKKKKKQKRFYEDYAIIYRDWAYINPTPPHLKVHIKPEKSYPKIIQAYQRRPKEFSSEKVNIILKELKAKYPNIGLAKLESKRD